MEYEKKILMIAYFFPPIGGIGAAGSQRVLKFAKYLPQQKWKPIVLTVQEPYYESYLSVDYSLLDKLPRETKVIRTPVIRWMTKILNFKNKKKFINKVDNQSVNRYENSDFIKEKGLYQRLKDTFTDLFEIPDEEMGWFIPGVIAGVRAIRRENIDAIYATGRPWTTFLIGTVLKVVTKKPLVVDFRDPWLTNPFRLKYSKMKNELELYLERKVIETADLVIANTHELREEFVRRFPKQTPDKFISLLNGFDPDDCSLDIFKTQKEINERFSIVHTGFLYGKRDPKILLEAIKLLFDKGMIDRNKINIIFVGSVELNYDIKEYVSNLNIDDAVTFHDHVPYKECLEYLWKSDVMLLLQPGTKTQVPSKLFDYIGAKKPILAISPRHGSTYNLVLGESMGEVAQPDDVQEVADIVYKMYQQWSEGFSVSHSSANAYQKFNVKNITSTFAVELSRLVG